MFRDGLRVSPKRPTCGGLTWTSDRRGSTFAASRVRGRARIRWKGDELRALRKLHGDAGHGSFVFETERGGPMVRSEVNKITARAGQLAGIEFPVTPHMLRHTCGFVLANKGVPTRTLQEYLGHASIQNTVRYTALVDCAFRGLWD
jgi:type 1 fimbriae regulatory protein FimB/type 1 fimbriae regulatory protein FimE